MAAPKPGFRVLTSDDEISNVTKNLRPLIGISLEHPEWTYLLQTGAYEAMQIHRSVVVPRLIQHICNSTGSQDTQNALYWLIELREPKVIEILIDMLQSQSEQNCQNARGAIDCAQFRDRVDRAFDREATDDHTVVQFLQRNPLLAQAIRNHAIASKSVLPYDPVVLAIEVDTADARQVARNEIEQWLLNKSVPTGVRTSTVLKHFAKTNPEEYGPVLLKLFEIGGGKAMVQDALEYLNRVPSQFRGSKRHTARELAIAIVSFLVQQDPLHSNSDVESTYTWRRRSFRTIRELGLRRELMRLIKHLKGYTSSLVLLRDLSLLDVSGFYNLFLTTIYSLTDPRRYLWPMANVAEKSLPSCIAFQIREKLKAFRLTESECRALARLTNTCPEAVFREFKVAVSLTPFQRMELASPVSGFDEQALLKLAQLSDFPVETLRKGFARWKGQGEGPSNWGGAVYNILKNAGLLAYLDKKIVGDYSGEIIDLCNATAGAVRADELYLTNIPETAQQVDEDEEDYCCKPPRWMMTLLSDGVMYECPMQADRDDRIIMVWFINRILIEKQSPLRFFVFRFDVGFFALCTTNDVTQRLIAEYKFPPYPEYQRRIDSPVWGGLE